MANSENKKEGFINQTLKNITNKPFKIIYRCILIGLVAVVFSNTNNNITEVISKSLKKEICKYLNNLTLTDY